MDYSVRLCDDPQPHLTPGFSHTANFKITVSKTFEGKVQILRWSVCSHQICALFYACKCNVYKRQFGNGVKRLSL